MATFLPKQTLHLQPEPIWDYIVSTDERTLLETPAIIDADDPEDTYISAAGVVNYAKYLASSLEIADGIQKTGYCLCIQHRFSVPPSFWQVAKWEAPLYPSAPRPPRLSFRSYLSM